MRFGVFIVPHHLSIQNPTLAIQSDLDLIADCDALGFDEAWVGEHHSGGYAIIASPEVFLATAAERTKRIKLGTGVVCLPFHNPLWVAERIVLLDHLTKGRIMLGLGAGAMPSDGLMIGLRPEQHRPLMEQSLDILMRLLKSEEPVSIKTDTYELKDARIHIRPFSNPLFDVAVTALASPVGARLVGKHGLSLLSMGLTLDMGFDALALHWNVVEQEAARVGKRVDRAGWRLTSPMHLAETEEQALADVRYGIEQWFHFWQKVAAVPGMDLPADTVDQMIALVNKKGLGVIGTPDAAIRHICRLEQQSGGFGCFMLLDHEWARPSAKRQSYELFARYVMPELQGHSRSLLQARERQMAMRSDLFARNAAAVQQASAARDK